MALFDKLKQTAATAKEKAVSFAEEKKLNEKFAQAREAVKKTWNDSASAVKQVTDESKALKQPIEGAIIRYEVIYLGGLPEYPKAKSGAIGFNVLPDKFVLAKTFTSKDWFSYYEIPYNRITDVKITKRTISNTEWLLGGGDNVNQQQENNICISFNSESDNELQLRVEMLTGFNIYKQAATCLEFMDILRQNNIMNQFKSNGPSSNVATNPLEQIEKLAKLRDAGILSESEFEEKKSSLLAML